VECKTITLKAINSMQKLVRPHFLIIDIEGSEHLVLQGNDWNSFSPDLICVQELEIPFYSSDFQGFLVKKLLLPFI